MVSAEREEGRVDHAVVLTFDVDWAPDFMIDAIARDLADRDVKSTWHVTHASPAIDRLRERPDLFELGIHPNFLAGSSHGDTVAEVLRNCMSIVPEATTMRSHALVQSSPILSAVIESTPIRCDSSVLLSGARHLAPTGFPHAEGPLLRIPYFWEDDVEMLRAGPCWALGEDGAPPGLRVYDFHPVHVFLNAGDLRPYHALRRLGALSEVSEQQAADFVQPGQGAGTLLLELADHLAVHGSRTLRDVATAHLRSEVA
jgi:hypothetical protein